MAEALGLHQIELDAGILFQSLAGTFGKIYVDTGPDLLGDPSCPFCLCAIFLEALNVLKSVFHLIVNAVSRRECLRPQRR
ncbi:hypothetical protein D3C73_1480050 [compost metagenome]